jgi:hypothetical protein
MVLNATFNNISAISRRSVLLVEETRVPGENHRPAGLLLIMEQHLLDHHWTFQKTKPGSKHIFIIIFLIKKRL